MGPIGQQPGKVLIHCLCHHLLDSQSDTQEGRLLLQSCIPYLKSGGYPPSYTIKGLTSEHGCPIAFLHGQSRLLEPGLRKVHVYSFSCHLRAGRGSQRRVCRRAGPQLPGKQLGCVGS